MTMMTIRRTEVSNSKDMALATIADLKENFPDYYAKLYPQCWVSKNIMSSYECDLCENLDMFVRVKEMKQILEQRLEDANYLVEKNIQEIIEEAMKGRG